MQRCNRGMFEMRRDTNGNFVSYSKSESQRIELLGHIFSLEKEIEELKKDNDKYKGLALQELDELDSEVRDSLVMMIYRESYLSASEAIIRIRPGKKTIINIQKEV